MSAPQRPETLPPETLPPETLPPETLPPETLPPALLIGTADGLHRPGLAPSLAGRRVGALARQADGRWLALADGSELWVGEGDEWELLAALEEGGLAATCLAGHDGGALVGTSQAHLLRVGADGSVERVAAFDAAPQRDRWYTPWGGPPDTRSLAVSPLGPTYAGVHVGGVLRADDPMGGPWVPTIDIDADMHQVQVAPDGAVLVACARGFATSADEGGTWQFVTSGLHGAYSRALAVADGWLLLSASTGPQTDRAAVYRRPLAAAGSDQPFVRCGEGLPEWFGANVDTGQLAAAGPWAAVGTSDGTVYASADSGATWSVAASGLPPVACLALA